MFSGIHGRYDALETALLREGESKNYVIIEE